MISPPLFIIAEWSSLVAHWVHTPKVARSNRVSAIRDKIVTLANIAECTNMSLD